jgi:hypothetical protein
MQTASATLAAAIDAPVRYPLVRLRVDWDRSGSFTDLPVKDLTADVTSMRLSNELTSDLPLAVKLFAGSSASESTVTLAHRGPDNAPEQHGGWYYSPANAASPLAAYDRKDAPCLLEVGCLTEAGPEYLTVLTGYVRSLEATSGGRNATMRISDGAESMRGQNRLPPVIADGATSGSVQRPGLNTTFLADWVARQAGYHASPPPRANCLFSATMHGSGWPEVGRLQEFHGNFGSKLSFSPTPEFPSAARWVQAVNTDGSPGQEMNYILAAGPGTTGTNNGQEFSYEGWHKLNATGVDQPFCIAYNTGQATPFISLMWQGSVGGQLQLLFHRGAGDAVNRAAAGPTVSPGTSSYHYYAVHVAFTSTQAIVTFRYDSTTTGPVTVSTGSVTAEVDCDTIGIARGKISAFADGNLNGLTEHPQATNEATAGNWNDAYAPTAQIRPSAAIDNRLAATPIVQEEGWGLLQEIARSEFATTGFDEHGMLTYWPRDRWTTPPYDTVQATVDPDTLKELALLEATDQVINQVVIRSRAPSLEGPQTVWKLPTVRSVAAGATLVIIANLDTPVGNLDTTIVYGTALGSSRYLAGTRADGLGAQATTNLTFQVEQLDPEAVKITVTNISGIRVWLTGDADASATYAGKPYLWLDGVKINFGDDADGASSGTRVEASDPASIARFGAQLWEAPDNDFRQDDDDLQMLADDLLDDCADPPPAIQDIPVKGDLRWQLGDRLRVVDTEGLALDDEFHLTKINLDVVPGEGMTATVSLRGA